MIAEFFFIVVDVMAGWIGSFMGMFRSIEVESSSSFLCCNNIHTRLRDSIINLRYVVFNSGLTECISCTFYLAVSSSLKRLCSASKKQISRERPVWVSKKGISEM